MATDRISFQDGPITLSLSIEPEKREHILRVQCGGTTATLGAQEAINLLQWLYEHRDTLLEAAHPEIEKQELPRWAQREQNDRQEP